MKTPVEVDAVELAVQQVAITIGSALTQLLEPPPTPWLTKAKII